MRIALRIYISVKEVLFDCLMQEFFRRKLLSCTLPDLGLASSNRLILVCNPVPCVCCFHHHHHHHHHHQFSSLIIYTYIFSSSPLLLPTTTTTPPCIYLLSVLIARSVCLVYLYFTYNIYSCITYLLQQFPIPRLLTSSSVSLSPPP